MVDRNSRKNNLAISSLEKTITYKTPEIFCAEIEKPLEIELTYSDIKDVHYLGCSNDDPFNLDLIIYFKKEGFAKRVEN